MTKLQAQQLCCSRQGKILFEDLSFDLQAGEALLIEGPNGSGKSSLLKLLAGLMLHDKGEVLWELNLQQELHYIGHTNGMKLGLTINENLQILRQLSSVNELDLEAVLSALQLDAYKNTLIKHLSAGQKRRVALAKLFLLPKSVWILDEPLTALDIKTQAFFISQLEMHLHKGGIAIISSHHPIHIETCKTQTLRLSEC